MSRVVLDDNHRIQTARAVIVTHQIRLLREVQTEVAANDVVTVGMRHNPFRARREEYRIRAASQINST